MEETKNSLEPEGEGSLVNRRRRIAESIESTRVKLDEPSRRYQEYLQKLAEWRKRREEIEGSSEASNSVKGLEAKLAALEALPGEISGKEGSRARVIRDIFRLKETLLSDYRRLYSPIQGFMDRHPLGIQGGGLEFTASILEDGFTGGLLEMIHQGRRGSFQGEREGRERIRDILASSDFSTEGGVESFIAKVRECLEHDKQEGNRPVRLRDQIVQDTTPEDVYNFLYGLSYLKPRFELRWQGKPLAKLSPGERGSLLLVFYLLIDKRDVPLVIDQPEENVDNQTIATLLVPALKHAKRRRQIVIVTHNPNLAVVCDADQVLHAHLDKTEGNRVSYTSGAIEDPTITQLIVDVLEGTKPAFDLRDAKYEVLEPASSQ